MKFQKPLAMALCGVLGFMGCQKKPAEAVISPFTLPSCQKGFDALPLDVPNATLAASNAPIETMPNGTLSLQTIQYSVTRLDSAGGAHSAQFVGTADSDGISFSGICAVGFDVNTNVDTSLKLPSFINKVNNTQMTYRTRNFELHLSPRAFNYKLRQSEKITGLPSSALEDTKSTYRFYQIDRTTFQLRVVNTSAKGLTIAAVLNYKFEPASTPESPSTTTTTILGVPAK